MRKKWGTKAIARIATELRTEFPQQRGFSRSNLYCMRQMARAWPDAIAQQTVAQLLWSDRRMSPPAHRAAPAHPRPRRPAPHASDAPYTSPAHAPYVSPAHARPRPRSPYARPHDD
ncbi:DUF1016 N-terminal domain-containing protein [Streptomyces cyaneofuscatus]|uniref:DUF1016 N-terminal domain-containing protein n=1 Tax=Streptomyces cyaneofuscatus TaxID=66883 RepID=UPI003647AC12